MSFVTRVSLAVAVTMLSPATTMSVATAYPAESPRIPAT